MSALEHSIEETKNVLSGLKMMNRERPLNNTELFILLKIFVAVNMFPDEIKNAVEPDLISDLEALNCASYGTCDVFYKTNKQKLNVLSELKSKRPEQSGGNPLYQFLFVATLMVTSSLVNAAVSNQNIAGTFRKAFLSPEFHAANYDETQADRPSMTPAVIYTSFVNGTDASQIPTAQANVRDIALLKGNYQSISPTQDTLWAAPQSTINIMGYDTGVVSKANGPVVQSEIQEMCSGLPSGQSYVGIAETTDFNQEVIIGTNSGVCVVNTDKITNKPWFKDPTGSTSASVTCHEGTFTPDELAGFGNMVKVVPKGTDLFGGKSVGKFYVSVTKDTGKVVTPSIDAVVDTIVSAGQAADKINTDVATFSSSVTSAIIGEGFSKGMQMAHNIERVNNAYNAAKDDGNDFVGAVARDYVNARAAESYGESAKQYGKKAANLMAKQGVRKSYSKTGNRIPLSRTELGGSLKKRKSRSRRSRRGRKSRRGRRSRRNKK